jgi:hypothetical protein
VVLSIDEKSLLPSRPVDWAAVSGTFLLPENLSIFRRTTNNNTPITKIDILDGSGTPIGWVGEFHALPVLPAVFQAKDPLPEDSIPGEKNVLPVVPVLFEAKDPPPENAIPGDNKFAIAKPAAPRTPAPRVPPRTPAPINPPVPSPRTP